MSKTPETDALTAGCTFGPFVEALAEKCRELEMQRNEAIKAIVAFCEASQWCAKDWKNQDHIKPLFDIYATATAGKGEHCTCGQGFNPDCPSEAHHKAKGEGPATAGGSCEACGGPRAEENVWRCSGCPHKAKAEGQHDPDCDVLDANPDGIRKPCNCGNGDVKP